MPRKTTKVARKPEKPLADEHPVYKLFEGFRKDRRYPEGVIEVPEQINGPGFFPGCTGLWWGGAPRIPALPVGKVMILGHDFHSETGYEESRERGHENLEVGTWKYLRKLLERVPIGLRDCFFTNVYMGLRKGARAMGPFPGATDSEFVERCQEFFLLQVAVQQPKLILALGAYVPHFLAPLSKQLEEVWKMPSSFSSRDAGGTSICREVVFNGVNVHPCVVASIVHPSMRNSNVHHRRWQERGLSGDEAELEYIKHAVALVDMNSTS